MSRRVSEAEIQQALRDKKISPREFRESRRSDPEESESGYDHPLIAQGKAMQSVAEKLGAQGKLMENLIRELANAHKSKDNGIGATLTALMTLIGQNNSLVKQMMIDMVEMRKSQQEAGAKPRKGWKLKVNRNSSGFADTVDIIPVEDAR